MTVGVYYTEPPCAPPRAPPPVPPAASNPHRVPLGSHHPLHLPWRNEQRAISLLLNACHKSPRAPSRSPSLPAPIFHLFHPPPCRGSLPCFTSSPPKTPPSLAQLRISSLAFSGSISLHYVSSLLSSAPSLYLFYLLSCVSSTALTSKEEKEKMENAQNAYSALFTSLFKEK